jgi:hypothetical protein
LRDVELKLDDGTMPASFLILRMMSYVFSNALDAQTGCQTATASKATGSSACPVSKTTIPLPGVSKEQWLRIAEFLYPVVPSPKIKDWAEAEYLLEVGELPMFLYHACAHNCFPAASCTLWCTHPGRSARACAVAGGQEVRSAAAVAQG